MARSPFSEDSSGLKKGPWTPQEDEKLVNYIHKHGHGSWRALPKLAGLNRCGKSCRLRWINYLRPDIKRGNFSQEEEQTILNLHSILGNKWSAIAGQLPGRTDNEIKNYWHTHLKKKLIHMGFDRNTHLPQTHHNNLFSIFPLAVENHLWDANAAKLQMAKLEFLNYFLQPPSIPMNPNFIEMETPRPFSSSAVESVPFSHLPPLQNVSGEGYEVSNNGGASVTNSSLWHDDFLVEDPLFLQNIG